MEASMTGLETKESERRYRIEIDGLRGLAILAVIINHVNKAALPSGYLGVDIFFVVSGYVITASLARHESKNLKHFLLAFYARRVKRLVPALAVFVFIMSLLICLVNPEPGTVLGLGRRALFGLSNLQLFKESTNYFATSTELNPFTHTWSLAVEEQFYFVFPLFVWFAGIGRLGPSKQSLLSAYNRLYSVTIILSLVSYALFCFLYPVNQPAAYFLMPPRFWEIGLGCLLFMFEYTHKALFSSFQRLPAGLIFLALVVSLLAPLSWAVVATTLTVFLTVLLLSSLRQSSAVYALLSHRWLVYIGKISYSLYLWHWGVLSLSRWTMELTPATIPVLLVLMFLLAAFSYQYLETPLRYATWSVQNLQTIIYGVVVSAGAAMLAFLIGKQHEHLFLGKFKGEDFIYVQRDMECEMLSPNPALDWKTCLDRHGDRPHIFVLGDSHSSNLVPSLRAVAARHGFVHVRYLSNAIKGRHNSYTLRNRDAELFWENSLTFRQFSARLKAGDLVVFSHGFSQGGSLEPIRVQLDPLVEAVKHSGSSLLLVDDIPQPCASNDFARGFVINPGRGCGIAKRTVLRNRLPLTQLLKARSKGRVQYLDPINSLCPGDYCYPTLNGRILYADPSPHFSKRNPAPLRSLFDQFLSHKNSAFSE